MLLRFCATNFLSLRDTVELSFIASSLKEFDYSTVPSRFSKHGVLPVVAIYGANASGKSNVIFALRVLRSIIANSFSKEEEGLPHKPFLLDDESQDQATEFCLDFLYEGVRHQFGLKYSRDRVLEEWLYAFPNVVQQVLYSRLFDGNDYSFYFGRNLGGSNKQIQSITRKNALFISAAAKSNHPVLAGISRYFSGQLVFSAGSVSSPLEIAAILDGNQDLIDRVANSLRDADTGIAGIKIEDHSLPAEFKTEMAGVMRVFAKMSGNLGEIKFPERTLRLGHLSDSGDIRYLEYADESLGTRHLLSLLPSMIKCLDAGGALILDEITTGLHTLLAKKIVDIFMNRKINKNGAQLIFSTHDTNLLAPGVLRRDSIWLAEKSQGGVTSLFSLIDYKTKNTDNIERGYIQGRFGAVPFLRDLTEMEKF